MAEPEIVLHVTTTQVWYVVPLLISALTAIVGFGWGFNRKCGRIEAMVEVNECRFDAGENRMKAMDQNLLATRGELTKLSGELRDHEREVEKRLDGLQGMIEKGIA